MPAPARGPGTAGPRRVTVIGAGITGLAVACALRARLGDDAAITVLDAADQPGGVIAGVRCAGMLVDAAADAIAATPEALRERLLGLGVDLPVVGPQGASQPLVEREGALALGRPAAATREVVGIAGGIWRLPAALAGRVEQVRCGSRVTAVRAAEASWSVSLAGGEEVVGDAVVVALPPGAASAIVGDPGWRPPPAFVPRQVVLLAYRQADLPRTRGTGFLRPAALRDVTPVTGVTWIDVKWPASVPRHGVAIARVVLEVPGGALDRADAAATASALVADLWRVTAPRLDVAIVSWLEALPEATTTAPRPARQPRHGLILAGSARGLSGIAACLDDAVEAAAATAAALGGAAGGRG